jgi:MFS transporter, DHA2 family, multidrug resistance protein
VSTSSDPGDSIVDRQVPDSSQSRSRPEKGAIYPDGLPVPRRYWAIAAILLAMMMSVLDSTIANIALPSIARDFRVSEAASIWVINAYQVAILISLLPLSSLGEIVGYRRISQVGLAVFTVASLACALAPSLLTLSIARVIQGLGAAGIMSVNAALVRFTYPQRMLGRAIGLNAFVVATSAVIGPSLASAVMAVAHWRWLFAINGPIGVIAILIATYALPYSERVARKLNHVGALLNAAAFGLLVSGLQALAHDEAILLAVVQLLCGGVVAVLLVRHELNRAAPLIPFDLLRIRLFSLSVLASVCSFTAQMAGLVALPFEIQRMGHSPVETGILMTPWPAAVAVAAPLAGYLADRHPAGMLGGIGLLGMAAGLELLAALPMHSSGLELAACMALCGLGFGLFQSPNNRTMISSAPRTRSGAAGGVQSTARLLGQSLGAAFVAVMFRMFAARGSHVVLSVAAGIALVAALVSVVRLHPSSRAPQEGTVP